MNEKQPFTLHRGALCSVIILLFLALGIQLFLSVRRESITWDEDDHIWAGYSSWKHADFGINPEHPPLVKMVATLPLLGMTLHQPAERSGDFKVAAFLNGREFLFQNDANTILARVRTVAAMFTFLLAALVLICAWQYFGEGAALLALAFFAFDPNLIAHGAFVTTDMGVSCLLFASCFAFYRYCKVPSCSRVLLAGLAVGLALGAKHSGILIFPMLMLLSLWELCFADVSGWRERGLKALRLCGALVSIAAIGIAILWAMYGFRYAARPTGLVMTPTLAESLQKMPHSQGLFVATCAHFHLLPESYLYGLLDVQQLSNFMPSYIFGQVHAHGVWYYFPVAFVIKSTLAMLVLTGLCLAAPFMRNLKRGREIAFLLIPMLFYFAVAMTSGVNIGMRHILPLYAFLIVLGAGVLALLAQRNRAWLCVAVLLLAVHMASSLHCFPNYISYSNELWGGPTQTYKYLSDSNTDWAQQLKSVNTYLVNHGVKQCWFAYFADGVVDTHYYGIPCRSLPTPDTLWVGQETPVPAEIDGPVLVSVGTMSGFEFGDSHLNPYTQFIGMKPVAVIDNGVFVFDGHFKVGRASAVAHTQVVWRLMSEGKMDAARAEAQAAVAADAECGMAQEALGDVLNILGRHDEAVTAYRKALASAMQLAPDAREDTVHSLQKKIEGKK